MGTIKNLILLYLATLCNSAYRIHNDRDIPSYLYGEVIEIDETQNFPKKIEINMTLTPSIGTLLFGEDSIGNQIVIRYYSWIVTHVGQTIPYIEIVYRGKNYGRMYLSEFCGCKYNCLYQSINLGIGVSRNTIAMLCNGVDLKGDYISKKKEGFEGYPRININKTGIKGNKAVFYVGNYPNINGKGHDPDQIGGCISSVFYMDEPIKMKVHGNGATFGRCNKKCTDPSICNGGTCFETLSSAPLLCDCTNSLGSGNDCSITPKRENKILYGTFTPKAVKVVWKTNDREIIRMESKKYNVSIYVDYELLWLKFTKQGSHTISYKILDNYVVFSYHIMIIIFHDTYIEVEFPLLNKLKRINVHTKVDNLIFSKLYLFSSNNGVIDVQQKAVLDNIVWFPFDESSTVSMDKPKVSVTFTTTQQTIQPDAMIHNNNNYTTTKLINKINETNITNKTHKYKGISKSENWIIIALLILIILIILIMLAGFVYFYIRHKRRNNPVFNKSEYNMCSRGTEMEENGNLNDESIINNTTSHFYSIIERNEDESNGEDTNNEVFKNIQLLPKGRRGSFGKTDNNKPSKKRRASVSTTGYSMREKSEDETDKSDIKNAESESTQSLSKERRGSFGGTGNKPLRGRRASFDATGYNMRYQLLTNS